MPSRGRSSKAARTIYVCFAPLLWSTRAQSRNHRCMHLLVATRKCPCRSRPLQLAVSLDMSFPETQNAYSLEGIASFAEELVKKNKQKEDETAKTSVCLAIAGGGGHAISALSATPGASSLLLEGTVAYDRKSYCSYVNLPTNTKGFKYSSYESAKMASEAALKKALNYISTNNLKRMGGCVGVGCASTLVTSSVKGSDRSHANIVATAADGGQLYLNVTLAGQQDGVTRSRLEEDYFVSNLVLRAIQRLKLADGRGKVFDSATTTELGDSIHESWSGFSGDGDDDDQDAPFVAANQILSEEAKSVLLLPVCSGTSTKFRALKYSVIPSGSLVFPGSFNPPHSGHVTLASAAVKAAKNTLAEDVRSRTREPPIFFELSLINADKPPIDPRTVSDRLNRMLELQGLPEKWGILLTRAPLFAEKLTCIDECILDSSHGPLPKVSFVIGSDTMLRIVDPKYYGHNQTTMVETIRSMNGVHFVVGGRVEQNKDMSAPRRFVEGSKELLRLPQDIQSMFTIIEEKDFRVDISSTEIRQLERANGAKGD